MREQVLAKGASEKPVPSGESVGGEDQLRPFSPCLPGTPMAPGQGLAAGGPQCFTVGTVIVAYVKLSSKGCMQQILTRRCRRRCEKQMTDLEAVYPEQVTQPL